MHPDWLPSKQRNYREVKAESKGKYERAQKRAAKQRFVESRIDSPDDASTEHMKLCASVLQTDLTHQSLTELE